MNFGDILAQAAFKDLAFEDKKNELKYFEYEKGDKFQITFHSEKFKEASIECSVPYTGKEEEKNYLRLYFLSMVFNAAILGMKRLKHKKNKI